MFAIRENNSTVWKELLGGLTTFLAMSYILFVQVAFLKTTGMEVGGIIFATCVASGVASIIMGLWANYPIGLAPGMGENNYFAFMLVPALAAWGLGIPGWQAGLALIMVVGVVFFLLTWTGVRTYIVNAMPAALRWGVAAGIGLLIATVGLSYGHLITFGGAVPEAEGFANNPAAWLTLIGIAVILVLTALRVPGAVLIGIVVNALLAMFVFRLIPTPQAVFSCHIFAGVGETVGGAFRGLGGLWTAMTTGHGVELLVFAIVLLFMDLFDTIGTLVGVAGQAGLMVNDRLPRVEKALAADAVGTTLGGALGASTVTSYIESAAGVSVGARTGLAAVVVGVLMLAALFFRPIIELIGGGAGSPFINPMLAPALIFVGALMLGALRRVDWDDATEYVPAFLAAITMPLTMSISYGIAIGFVTYALGKLLTGRARQCSLVVYLVAALFVARYVFEAIFTGA